MEGVERGAANPVRTIRRRDEASVVMPFVDTRQGGLRIVVLQPEPVFAKCLIDIRLHVALYVRKERGIDGIVAIFQRRVCEVEIVCQFIGQKQKRTFGGQLKNACT